MSWIGVADRRVQRFSCNGLGIDRRSTPIVGGDAGAIMPAGTMMVEALITGEDKPETLVNFGTKTGLAPRSLHLKAIPGGGVSLVQTLGEDMRHATLQHGGSGRTSTLRISYSWNTRSGWARLVLERPETAQVFTAEIEAPLPMLVQDLQSIVMAAGERSPNFVFVAVSTRVEPLGPAPSLGLSTPVATPFGFTPAGDLKRGDTVMTRDGDAVPVLYAIHRRAPARGSFLPVRLHTPYFGLQRDLIVAPSQRLLIGGSEVEYMFGVEAVLVPAGHLINGTAATREPCGPVVEYTQLILPGHEAINAAGCHLESLYIGRIRRDPEALAASAMRNLPRNTLPEHAGPGYPVLGAFEAITLAEQRAA